ncbi:hypothetical protein WR25_22688 [Diploscapter pachys]|uniref:Uncharacterized protein n=1 Tax=Diploscapter pachys TaxID=2018661 RepID=A0A2A2M0H4_9BILA|nr:hypothetical protein WR25_22688 [Diploscapter pachys]
MALDSCVLLCPLAMCLSVAAATRSDVHCTWHRLSLLMLSRCILLSRLLLLLRSACIPFEHVATLLNGRLRDDKSFSPDEQQVAAEFESAVAVGQVATEWRRLLKSYDFPVKYIFTPLTLLLLLHWLCGNLVLCVLLLPPAHCPVRLIVPSLDLHVPQSVLVLGHQRLRRHRVVDFESDTSLRLENKLIGLSRIAVKIDQELCDLVNGAHFLVRHQQVDPREFSLD